MKISRVFWAILCVCILSGSTVQASDTLSFINNLRLGGYVKHGTMLPHHASIAYSVVENISGFELNLSTDSYGRSPWDALFRYPRWGIGYNYSTLGNSEVFGNAHALFGFVDVPFRSPPRKFNIYYQFTVGLSYLTKHFDIEENPMNMSISSGVNVYGDLKFTLRYIPVLGHELAAGFSFTHYSNGKMGTPNQGLNTFNLTLGYLYNLTEAKQERVAYTGKPILKKHEWDILLSAGLKADDQASENRYLISTVVADYRYNPGPKYAFGMGVDLFYDQSLGPNVAEKDGIEYTESDLIQLGVHGGLYARYGRALITGHVGTYLRAELYKYARVYTRIGIRYSVTDHLFLNLALKAHYAIADYVEWGIGYRIY